ncbi:metallo-beta-lactamase domain protein [Anaerofustis stercorihominis DSM 17244]|uniref:Metallo-beta-lactamase domain protein n=1 Tax=Anaerofustis stercorihominis DSM 17244 TaxID=445971 RepID=B1C9H8_9FIRM|nr:MBL fold metallo-hydrolase [Anaerofustis stercorihominis]EDS72549.1 metallo-beta-lactamase domain protein [Anaerofustis stercorihominis DSM 17244]
MDIRSFQLGPVGTNCYIITKNDKSIIIDPGHNDERLMDYIRKENLNIEKILLTHGHFDHIAGTDMVRDATGAKVYIHELDNEMLSNPNKNGSALMMGMGIKIREADEFVYDGEKIDFEGSEIEVIFTPGHSKGGVCYKIDDAGVIFCGDTLFLRSIGRTDLYGGSIEVLESSIRNKIYTLDKNYTLLSGHGDPTDIEGEKKYNGFFRA